MRNEIGVECCALFYANIQTSKSIKNNEKCLRGRRRVNAAKFNVRAVNALRAKILNNPQQLAPYHQHGDFDGFH